jgi:hypothetical protein
MYAHLKVRPFAGDSCPSWSRPWICFRFSLNSEVHGAIRNVRFTSRLLCANSSRSLTPLNWSIDRSGPFDVVMRAH